MNRTFKKVISHTAIIGVYGTLIYFFPIPFGALLICGLWDISRNKQLGPGVFRQYFITNGIATWLASPLNILFDILSLPYVNKGVYELDDLPAAYQAEILGLLRTADEGALVEKLELHMESASRVMLFFKWYGRNVDSPIEMSRFHADYNFVRTIGVSAFKQRESTSRHFGPFRPSLRVLYCLNDDVGEDAYIKVGPVENHWRESKLFIFDDTLLHQSFNETDSPRYCLFVDVIRPSYLPFVFDLAVGGIRLIFQGMNGIFYKNWKLVNN